MITFDASDFEALARDMDRAAASDLIGKIEPVISKGALETKKRMQADIYKSPSFKGIDTVDYDIDRFTNHIRAEIGPPTAGRVPGDLYHIAVHGGSRGGGGTVQDPEYLLEAEAPALERFIGDILEDLI